MIKREMILIYKNIVLVFGNGISIDLLSKLVGDNSIDLSNLFRDGDKVPWPANNNPGFLSQRYCPELWKIGARPNSSREISTKIIEDIITCANVSAIFKNSAIQDESSNVYIRAFYELVAYLKYLFIYYNNIVKDNQLETAIKKWGWSDFFCKINQNDEINNVTIITYNYDIFLERVLKLLDIQYHMVGFRKRRGKFRIIKPHGSISFISKELNSKELFSIKYKSG
jgi:hypothetical protein